MTETNLLPDAEPLFRVLTFIAPLPIALRERFKSFLKSEHYPRKHLLLKQGNTAHKIYFICQGFARAYFNDRDGREHTSWFMGPSDIMISIYSFFTQQPAAESIELLEESSLLSLTWDQLQTIYAEHPEFNYTGRLVTEKYYIRSEERAILLRTKKPAERYRLLLQLHPGILQKAALNQIASYLGMTPETLSRIRSQKEN